MISRTKIFSRPLFPPTLILVSRWILLPDCRFDRNCNNTIPGPKTKPTLIIAFSKQCHVSTPELFRLTYKDACPFLPNHQPYRITLPTKRLLSRQSVEFKHEPQTQLFHTIRRLGCGAPDSVTGYDGQTVPGGRLLEGVKD